MDELGMIYVPTACQKDERCRLHIHFHGCGSGLEGVGTWYVTNVGYNEVAEANNIIILYPNAIISNIEPFNPWGCFDMFGYLNDDM